MQKKLYRPAYGIVAVAAGAALVLTGCSDDNDSKDSAHSAVSSTGASTDTSAAEDQSDVEGLDVDDAQEILNEATSPDTSAEDLDEVADVKDPATKAALQGYAKGVSAAGYTHTVTAVKADGDDKATVTVTIGNPDHPERKVEGIPLVFVKQDGDWKLSTDAITQLGSMAGEHGGGH